MIRTKKSQNNKMITNINITPLTDICLVLLIIFMVTANALAKKDEARNLRIKLPQAATSEAKTPNNLTVRIENADNIYVNDDKVDFTTMGQKIDDYRAKYQTEMLVISSDENVPYKLVITTMDIARQHQINQIAFTARLPEVKP